MNMNSREKEQFKSYVVTHFQASTEKWDNIYSKEDIDSAHYQQRKDRVLWFVDQTGLPKGAHALDLGCGTGWATIELLHRSYVVAAVDISENMLDRARSNCYMAGLTQGVTFVEDDAENLSFDDDSFDLVISMGMIGFLPEWPQALKHIVRVMKPGGYLVITFENKVSLARIINPPQLTPGVLIKRRIFRIKPSEPLVIRYVPRKFEAILRNLGVEIRGYTSHGFGPIGLLGQRIFPDKAQLKLNNFLQSLSDKRSAPYLHRLGNSSIVVAQKPYA